jgi:malate/lactate dehydrogenase
MRIIARHRDWVQGATITESVDDQKSTDEYVYCRFTATIKKWQNWKIYEGRLHDDTAEKVAEAVRKIRDRIDDGDEEVFYEPRKKWCVKKQD